MRQRTRNFLKMVYGGLEFIPIPLPAKDRFGLPVSSARRVKFSRQFLKAHGSQKCGGEKVQLFELFFFYSKQRRAGMLNFSYPW